MKKANDRIEILTTQMENCVAELKVQRDIIEAGKKILFGEMAAMDVSSSGNHGWHDRMAAFMMMLCDDE